jgi:catechol-2,3-dioxygenase
MQSRNASRLAVVSIRTNRLKETIHFYRDVVGLTVLAHLGHQPTLDLGNNQFLVVVETNEPSLQSADSSVFPLLAFSVDNLEQAVQNLQSHGIEMPFGVESDPQNRWVKFYDPSGNLIELAEFNRSLTTGL